MKPTAALQRFIDDELARALLLAEQTFEACGEALMRNAAALSARDRTVVADLQRGLNRHRSALGTAFVQSLRQQLAQQFGDAQSTSGELPSMPAALSLVDETEVEVDVEMSRLIEAIRSEAETELRELVTYTAALAGDMDVAHDDNPFRPETMARALWDAVEALPMARSYQVALVRAAVMPYAQLLRKAYAGACARLDDSGVEPAVFRTIILPGGARRAHHQTDQFFDGQVNRVEAAAPAMPAAALASSRPAMEQALQHADELMRGLRHAGDRYERDRLRFTQLQVLAASAGSGPDRELIELLSRLFDHVLGDRRLMPDIQAVVARLQAPALRLALRNPATLDDYAHPVWQLMDRLALQGDTHPLPGQTERDRVVQFMHGLIDPLVQEQARDADPFRWALERLQAYEQHRLVRRLEEAEPEMRRLQALEMRVAGAAFAASTTTGALDIGQLATVPGELLDQLQHDGLAAARDAGRWLDARQVGDWLRMFTQGGRVNVQLMWTGDQGDISLFADAGGTRTWAVRRRALERLHAEQLLSLLEPRSLIREAAQRVLHKLAPAAPRRGA
jgi:hypothetical protein